jgi:hypothetical protein
LIIKLSKTTQSLLALTPKWLSSMGRFGMLPIALTGFLGFCIDKINLSKTFWLSH